MLNVAFIGILLAAPDIDFPEPIFDFATIFQGDSVIHTYKFKNRGQDTLKIDHVKSSCGCTAVLLSQKEIPPGGEGEIKATFRSNRFKDEVSKKITVFSNDPDSPQLVLTLQGKVSLELEITPSTVNLGTVLVGDERKEKVSLKFYQPNLKIEKIETTSGILSYKLAGDETEQWIELTLAPLIPLANFLEKLRIYTNSTKKPVIEVPVRARISGELELNPNYVYFGVISPSDPSPSRKVQLENLKGQDFTILNMEKNLQELKIDLKPLEGEKKGFSLELRLEEGFPPGTFQDTVKIYTDHPKYPVLNLPVDGVVK